MNRRERIGASRVIVWNMHQIIVVSSDERFLMLLFRVQQITTTWKGYILGGKKNTQRYMLTELKLKETCARFEGKQGGGGGDLAPLAEKWTRLHHQHDMQPHYCICTYIRQLCSKNSRSQIVKRPYLCTSSFTGCIMETEPTLILLAIRLGFISVYTWTLRITDTNLKKILY
jgi:hypothetical protein